MLLNSLDIMLEQFGQPGAPPGEGVDPTDPFPEAVPLKKFELLQKITMMRSNLQANGIYDEDLDLILQFGPELSYETILALINAVVDKLKTSLVTAGNKDNDKNNEERE